MTTSGRTPVNLNRVSELWNALQNVISSCRNEISVTTPNNDQIVLERNDLLILLERFSVSTEQNKVASSSSAAMNSGSVVGRSRR
jgi:hypothetical protein